MKTSSLKKKIVVCGASGNQGSSVVSHLLKEGMYEVYALTRDPLSDPAKELQKAGAKLAFGDLEDFDSLNAAFEEAYGVFGVTQPWSKDYKNAILPRSYNREKISFMRLRKLAFPISYSVQF